MLTNTGLMAYHVSIERRISQARSCASPASVPHAQRDQLIPSSHALPLAATQCPHHLFAHKWTPHTYNKTLFSLLWLKMFNCISTLPFSPFITKKQQYHPWVRLVASSVFANDLERYTKFATSIGIHYQAPGSEVFLFLTGTIPFWKKWALAM